MNFVKVSLEFELMAKLQSETQMTKERERERETVTSLGSTCVKTSLTFPEKVCPCARYAQESWMNKLAHVEF